MYVYKQNEDQTVCVQAHRPETGDIPAGFAPLPADINPNRPVFADNGQLTNTAPQTWLDAGKRKYLENEAIRIDLEIQSAIRLGLTDKQAELENRLTQVQTELAQLNTA